MTLVTLAGGTGGPPLPPAALVNDLDLDSPVEPSYGVR